MSLAQRYATTQNETASKERLMVLLFEAALRHIRSARTALEEKRVNDAHGLLTKATAIVTELLSTLDHNQAPQLCETLAIAFRQRQGPMAVRTKYDALVTNAVISAEELELAQRSARRKNLDIETVLIDEFQVKTPALGDALATYFGVPYEPAKADRIRSPELLRNMSREFCESNMWIPLEDSKDGIVVMALDPERTRASRIVNNVYPKSKIVYKVTTVREFNSTLDQMFGGAGMLDDVAMESDTRKVMGRLNPRFTGFKKAVKSLSGGQRQSVAIARAVHFNARVLIMDEPTAALGPAETAQVRDLIRQLKSEGIGIFLVSHDIHDVFDLSDRISVMYHGRKVGTVNKDEVTTDEVLAMIILGKAPEEVTTEDIAELH